MHAARKDEYERYHYISGDKVYILRHQRVTHNNRSSIQTVGCLFGGAHAACAARALLLCFECQGQR